MLPPNDPPRNPPNDPPNDPLGYNAMIHDALRGVVRQTLLQVKELGMPPEHHFYITFKTMATQVVLPLYLRQKYPESMTIVLQYQFHNLVVTDSIFSVTLSFGGKFETLTVPFAAITMFSDPEAQLVFNFEPLTDSLPNSLPDSLPDDNLLRGHPSRIADKPSATKPLSATGKKTSSSAPFPAAPPAWRGSIAYGAQSPLEPRPQKTTAQGKAKPPQKESAKGRLKPVATKASVTKSAKVLAFRPKDSSHENETPSKTP